MTRPIESFQMLNLKNLSKARGIKIINSAIKYKVRNLHQKRLFKSVENSSAINKQPNVLQNMFSIDILKRIFMLKLCTIPFLSKLLPTISYSMKINGLSPFIKFLVKKSFFKMFCGGETIEETINSVKKLENLGIGAIIDYSAESDFSDLEKTACDNLYELAFENIIKTIDMTNGLLNPIVAIKCSSIFSKDSLIKIATLYTIDELLDHRCLKDQKILIEMQRVIKICERAFMNNLTLAIDAEQSIFQDSIDIIAIVMMNKYNRNRPTVINTYQMYRKDGIERLKNHMNISKLKKFNFGCKIVRGAYLNFERNNFNLTGTQDVIFPTAEETHNQFDESVKYLINCILKSKSDHFKSSSLIIATHNQKSIDLAIKEINDHKMLLGDDDIWKSISFSQLYGMQDQLTLNIISMGYPCYKYIPYGPVDQVIPYLVRRIDENRAVVAQFDGEISAMKKELLFRIKMLFTSKIKK